MLEVITVAVVGFGFLTAYFSAKTPAGKNACLAVLGVTLLLAANTLRTLLGR